MDKAAGKRQKRPFHGEILIPADEAEERRLQRAAKDKEITRIARAVYVNAIDPDDLAPGTLGTVALTVRRHWQQIAGHLYPDAVVSHRSALVGGITPENELLLSHPTRFNRVNELPGVTIALLKGPPRLPGDMALGNSGLHWSSRPRMLLENLGKSRGGRRTVGRAGVEEKLVEILNASGEEALNRVRDDARQLAPQLAADFDTLNSMIGALLGTYVKGKLTTRAGKLVARGTPVDAERLTRFGLLADALRTTSVPDCPEVAGQDPARTHAAFLESYFSNYVEGTRFSIEEAEGIALHNRIVPTRPKDSHDILGVFKLILHPQFRSSLPAPMDILAGLKERHRLMLERRPEANPGEFKETTNYAGQTKFVDPAFVRGTLLEGVRLAFSVPEGLARAIFYAFLVSDIHPFNDGNGRLSRLIMNAELSRMGLARIIIPTLFHEQYVDAQRALTRGNDPEPLIRALSHIAKWGLLFDYADVRQVVAAMKKTNAFEEDPREYRLLRPDGSVFA
jgi:hypothetical protein